MRVEERHLWAACKKGDPKAREELILRNKGLVYKILVRRTRGDDRERDDLEQEGLLGLIKAVDRYQPGQGKFAPYACRWIEGAMKEYLRRWEWMGRRDRERVNETGEAPIDLLPLSVLDQEDKPAPDSDASVIVIEQMEREWLWQQVGRLLFGRQREAVLGYYRDEVKGKVLARAWGIHPDSFSNYRYEAVQKLAAVLKEEEGTLHG